ncbi:Uncharacterized conserved protein YutE, UPF0331/DUF86 family [Persephonella hydrogeniphila]|uniref:Uncharacterized conserved protein YutE, UPF0331/DUF86 family n=1 Tax=Persephonella hydrogeniphila TaxID=198703 RepID=A0A285N5U3_9AQUI|nr:HepT-like ribonuclease domain-containing protein [Persephonella hydrogeniphila]SNZ03366.1 Uncharacterized conserved protein YutE, UPF0331/DUF86 family [Persephonella hydrogeniphila]
MLDLQFLNDKASKLVLFLKKVDKILKNGREAFITTPIYPDRTQYYLISAYNELEEISCHLLKEITGEKHKGNCVQKIVKEQIFSEKLNRILTDYSNYISKIMEDNFSYSPEELYAIAKEIVKTLLEIFIKELAVVVKEIRSREPKLAIPVNIKKIQDHGKAIKSSVRKMSNFLNFPEEEFINTPLFIDRARYFSVVAVDSSLWICRHIMRKMKKKPDKNCFLKLSEESIISEETGKKLQEFSSLRDTLADPTKEIDPKKLYRMLKEITPVFLKFLSEISKALFKKTVQ